MIDLHYAPTPNGWKISILLEELGLPYTVVPIDIRAGEQFKPEFLAISRTTVFRRSLIARRPTVASLSLCSRPVLF
ncbi:Glutathione S-transferase, N-terminal domain [Bradyrhizobium sp. Gha]|nr:Glutathione S-transferase, N-terminal domain [Bradyrhizobium sp. Gha]